MANVTIALPDDVLAGAKELARERGLSVSAYLADRLRRDLRDRNLRAYQAWAATNVDQADLAAFDAASAAAVAESWSDSKW